VEPSIENQQTAMDTIYSDGSQSRWAFHYTDDPLVRYLRDRRLRSALDILSKHTSLEPAKQSVLVACGGVGGEGTFLANHGFKDVTVSDFSANALETCRRFDRRLKTRLVDAEAMTEVHDGAYDIVLVQDGLHHLPRPVLGFTEMLRVARLATIVIEPHWGMVGRHFGREWEVHGDAINYVFRWNRSILEQATLSYLLRPETVIEAHRMWDHNLAVARAVSKFPQGRRLPAARAVYRALSGMNRAGNMMIGVVVKPDGPQPKRLVSH
jgi:SAM-dependent methyltransferase